MEQYLSENLRDGLVAGAINFRIKIVQKEFGFATYLITIFTRMKLIGRDVIEEKEAKSQTQP